MSAPRLSGHAYFLVTDEGMTAMACAMCLPDDEEEFDPGATSAWQRNVQGLREAVDLWDAHVREAH